MAAAATHTHLTILVPAYNESGSIAGCVETLRDYIRREELEAEILVVDDGSTDGTREAAERALRGGAGRVLHYAQNRGKGYAVRRGVREAYGRWLLMTDVDLSAPIEEFRTLADAMRDRDADVVIGSRRVPGSPTAYDQTGLRRFASGIFNGVVRALTGLQHHDTQCGFKLLDRERVLPVVERMRIDGFAFDVELLFLCHRLGLKVVEVPVAWKADDSSHVRLLVDPLHMVKDLIGLRWNFRRGAYRAAPTDGSRATGPGNVA